MRICHKGCGLDRTGQTYCRLTAGSEQRIEGKDVSALSISTGSVGSSTHTRHEALNAPLIPRGRLAPFIVVTALFFLWAIPNNLNDILIRQFMKSFEINRSGAAGIQIWFYLGYFTLAIPAGQLMHRFGYKLGIITGLVLMGTG